MTVSQAYEYTRFPTCHDSPFSQRARQDLERHQDEELDRERGSGTDIERPEHIDISGIWDRKEDAYER